MSCCVAFSNHVLHALSTSLSDHCPILLSERRRRWCQPGLPSAGRARPPLLLPRASRAPPPSSSSARPFLRLAPGAAGGRDCRRWVAGAGEDRARPPEAGSQARGEAGALGVAAAGLGLEQQRTAGGATAPGERRCPARQEQLLIGERGGEGCCFSPTSRERR